MSFDFRADLHCHTTASDGTMSPSEIIVHAKSLGLKGLAITDHDSIAAYEEAIPIAKKEGIVLGTGVEFSSVEKGITVHVLGYDFDLKNEELISFCQRHAQRRTIRNQKILEKLEKYGISLTYEDLKFDHTPSQSIGRPHIAMALVRKGYVGSIQEAFNKWIGDESPAFDPGTPMGLSQTLEIIHGAEGKAFIAHPHLYKKPKVVEKLLEHPFEGIECYYSKCLPTEEQKWVRFAEKNNLLISGGSDFHGEVKPHIPLGCSWVNRTFFDQIFQRHLC